MPRKPGEAEGERERERVKEREGESVSGRECIYVCTHAQVHVSHGHVEQLDSFVESVLSLSLLLVGLNSDRQACIAKALPIGPSYWHSYK